MLPAACEQRCTADPNCNAIEVNGCNSDAACPGSCYHFYGVRRGAITNGGCVTNGDQKCFARVRTSTTPNSQTGRWPDAGHPLARMFWPPEIPTIHVL